MTTISIVRKGRSHYLLRKAITKKERDKVKAETKAKEELLKSIPNLKEEIEELRKELMVKQRDIERLETDRLILSDLYEKRIIDSQGNLLK